MGWIARFFICFTVSLNDRFATITDTMASAINTSKTASFPSGFTSNNCVIGGYLNQHTNNSWYSNQSAVNVITAPDGIRFQTSESAFLAKPIKVMLIKI